MTEYRHAPRRPRSRRYRLLRSSSALLGVVLTAAVIVVVVGVIGPPKRHQGDGSTIPTRTKTTNEPVAPPPAPVWRVAWGSGMAWGHGVASNVTVRDLATVGVGGQAVRVRISNFFGNEPLVISAGTIGVSAGGPAIQAGTLADLTFGGQPGVTIPVGQDVYSDPVSMAVTTEETLAVSIYVSGTDLVSVHPCCAMMKPVSFFTPNGGGNLTQSFSGAGLDVTSPDPRWIDAVDVLQLTGQGSIVVVGDSITDGYNTTLSWTSVLQRRIDALPASEQRAVVNEGISANALTSDVPTDDMTGGGPSGLSRLAPDALDQSGVSEIVLFLGTNDLWFGDTAQQLITGFEQAIAAAHSSGIRIVGVTLLPRSPGVFSWSPAQQAELEAVNTWILTSGAFDGVINLAPVVADVYNGACDATAMFPPFDSGDHLHPNAAGQTAMANAVDPTVLELPAIPQEPPLIPVTPSAGCAAAPAAQPASSTQKVEHEPVRGISSPIFFDGYLNDDRPTAAV